MSFDEAYLLSLSNERDYGAEAIEPLLQVMEKSAEDLVIFAGYKDRMDSFYESNPGLSSCSKSYRFSTHQKVITNCKIKQYRMTADAENQKYAFVM